MVQTRRKSGVERIAAERSRQIIVEGFGSEHDDRHSQGQLARAAAVYAMGPWEIYTGRPTEIRSVPVLRKPSPVWPFDRKWDKRRDHTRLRQLEIAGALIAAEIDRLLRGGHE